MSIEETAALIDHGAQGLGEDSQPRTITAREYFFLTEMARHFLRLTDAETPQLQVILKAAELAHEAKDSARYSTLMDLFVTTLQARQAAREAALTAALRSPQY
jgi:hypothetical protein